MNTPIGISAPVTLAAGPLVYPDITLKLENAQGFLSKRKREISKIDPAHRPAKIEELLDESIECAAREQLRRRSQLTIAALHLACFTEGIPGAAAGQAALSAALLFADRSRPLGPDNEPNFRGIYRTLDAAQRCLDFASRVATLGEWREPTLQCRLDLVQAVIDDAREGRVPQRGATAAALRRSASLFESVQPVSRREAAEIVLTSIRHADLIRDENPAASEHYLCRAAAFARKRLGREHVLTRRAQLDAIEYGSQSDGNTVRSAEEICKSFEKTDDTDHPLYVRSLWVLASYLDRHGDPERALFTLDVARLKLLSQPQSADLHALFVFEQLLRTAEDEGDLGAMRQTGMEALALGRTNPASGLFEKSGFLLALARTQFRGGEDGAELVGRAVAALRRSGELYTESGHGYLRDFLELSNFTAHPEAWLELAKLYVEITEAVYPARAMRWRRAEALARLCETQMVDGKLAEAAESGSRAREELCYDDVTPTPEAQRVISFSLCTLNIRLGRYSDALKWLEGLPESLEEAEADEPDDLVDAQRRAGADELYWLRRRVAAAKIHAHLNAGSRAVAYRECEQILECIENQEGGSSLKVNFGKPLHANILLTISELVIVCGQPHAALGYLNRAAEIVAQNPSAARSQGRYLDVVKGKMHSALGEHEAAVEVLNRGIAGLHERNERGYRLEQTYRDLAASLTALGRGHEARAAEAAAVLMQNEFGAIPRIVPID